MYNFTPSTVPGCRTPHLWLRGGRSLYDALGAEFTLLRRDPDMDVRELVLSRPDQHVAWRADDVPADPLALVDLVRGAGVREA
jgi:hypothetical protein